jgi:histidine ammonia-lyase
MKHFEITNDLNLNDISGFLKHQPKITISKSCFDKIEKCRQWLDEQLDKSDEPMYGINTGFGALCNIKIEHKDIQKLQENLIISHACGVGDEVPDEIVRLMLLLKIQNLSYGHSAIQKKTVQLMAELLNHDILPVVYEQGSLGASGDLAPLAHMSLPLLGMGEVKYKGDKIQSAEALRKAGLNPVSLESKEGLALLNGTQFMLAYGVYVILEAQKLLNWADVIGALSLDAFLGLPGPFNLLVHELRPHPGQLKTASRVLHFLRGSQLINMYKEHVQDPYSFRCIPQVHGASRDAVDYVAKVMETEMNSVTDNPTVFPDDDFIVSAGNFHGQPLALALDFLGIALSEIANISERRTYQLICGKRGLPQFLVAHPGLNSGFMIPQYTAASIVSQNKVLSHPASVDSIESSQGQEDHVSMGSISATKSLKIMQNVKRVLAIELFNAAQAIEFRRPAKTSPCLEEMITAYRKIIPFVQDDVIMYPLIHQSIDFLDNYELFCS